MLQVPLSPHLPDEPPGGGQAAPSWFRAVAENRPLPSGPDLLEVLESGHPDREWVVGVESELRTLSERSEIRLLACEFRPGPDGFLAIAATSPSLCAEVRRGDQVMAGFAALRDREQPLRVVSRIFREVCANGSIVSTREEQLEGAASLTVPQRVRQCFERDRFLASVAVLRQAAAESVADPEEMMERMSDEMMRLGRRGPEFYELMKEVSAARWREEEDRTLYGLLNAVTATARDLPDFRDRLDLEELGGALARLAPGPRHRRPDPEHATMLS